MKNLFVKIMIFSAVVMYGYGGQEEKGRNKCHRFRKIWSRSYK